MKPPSQGMAAPVTKSLAGEDRNTAIPERSAGTPQRPAGVRASTFSFSPGPVLTHLLLAAEVHTASPPTQSALLEATCDRQVTTAGLTPPLPGAFFVLATQNPI